MTGRGLPARKEVTQPRSRKLRWSLSASREGRNCIKLASSATTQQMLLLSSGQEDGKVSLLCPCKSPRCGGGGVV